MKLLFRCLGLAGCLLGLAACVIPAEEKPTGAAAMIEAPPATQAHGEVGVFYGTSAD